MVRNFDGTQPRKLHEVCASMKDCSQRRSLVDSLKSLRDMLMESGIRFYDPQNVLVQWQSSTAFRLRIVDFEPESRAFIPVDEMFPFLARMKIRRRFDRYMEMFAPIFA